jgi:hypothetical protein
MEQQGKKKEWVAPELLVLVRSHPEEAVLGACKLITTVGSEDAFSSCILTLNACLTFCGPPGTS